MVTLVAGGLLPGSIILALCFFGAFKFPYLGIPDFWLFRLALYLLRRLMIWYGGRHL